jgi:signal transduction histidine kinase
MADLVNAVHESYRQEEVKITPRISRKITDERGQNVERYFVYTIIPTHDSTGKVDGVAIYAEDETERRVREAAERLEQMKLMVENADQVALGLYDAQTAKLLQASPRYLDVLEHAHGLSSDQIIERKWQEVPFITPQEEAVKLFNACVKSGEPCRVPEFALRLNEGSHETVWVCSLTPINFKGENQTIPADFILVSAIEVTEQIRARVELERLHYLKDQFFSLASHELRTPLVPLMGYSEALIRLTSQPDGDAGRDQKIVEIAGRFRGQLKHLGRLTDDLLDVARLQTGKFSLQDQPVNLAEVAELAIEQARLLSDSHKIQFKVQKNAHPLIVRGDKERLVQVLNNILINAIKHAPQSEKIDVRLGLRRGAKDMAQIEVQDYGPGIAPDNIGTIFNRFFQVAADKRLAKGGLGLGLFIAKGIIEQHGGAITARSKVGDGSTFIIRLPLMTEDE